MKYRESGMPEESLWDTFFQPEIVLRKMGVDSKINRLLDIGCGYGTFLIPASFMVNEAVGLDVDPVMISRCKSTIAGRGLENVSVFLDDVSSDKQLDTLKANFDYVMLFNILHCEYPLGLLKKARSFLHPEGMVGVIHWVQGDTPRGPSPEIRPNPETIIEWAIQSGFSLKERIDLPPYHFGLIFTMRRSSKF